MKIKCNRKAESMTFTDENIKRIDILSNNMIALYFDDSKKRIIDNINKVTIKL